MQFKSKEVLRSVYYYTDHNNVRITKTFTNKDYADMDIEKKVKVSLSSKDKKYLTSLSKTQKYKEYNEFLETHVQNLLLSGEIILHAI